MVQHVIDTAHALGAERIGLVYGHGAVQIKTALADNSVDWIEQAEQLGTGHAVAVAKQTWQTDDQVLVLYGEI